MSDDKTFQTVMDDPSEAPRRGSGRSTLDKLREAIQAEVERPEITAVIPSRKNIRLTFSPNIDSDELKVWRRKASNKKTGELDGIKFSVFIIQNLLTGIYITDAEGVEDLVVDPETDEPLTFTSPEIMEFAEADTPIETVRNIFVIDPHLESLAMSLMDEAGYGEEVETEANPT